MKRKLARICGWCGKPLDKRSAKMLKEPDRHLVSHGICKPCLAKVAKEIENAILMIIPYALLEAIL